ncbi:MAG: hypothetical protein COB60_01195 [Flavobacteriaceae bacterium]|nr:MAG: hypothetical protein COB60_01195 [Flavobacteriaceae bacterium]
MIKRFLLFFIPLILFIGIGLILESGKIKIGYKDFNENISFEKNKVFSTKGLLALDSTSINFELFKDKTTLLQFSFNGCGPCKRAKQLFPNLLDNSPKNFQIITLSIDNYNFWKKDNFDKERWTKINIGDSELKNSLKITEYPTYFIINEDGKIISRPNNGIAAIRSLYQITPSTNINLIKESIGELKYTNRFWNFIFMYASMYSVLFAIILLFIFLVKLTQRKIRKSKIANN